MYYPDVNNVGPVTQSNWETLGPTQLQYDPNTYLERAYGWQGDFRGSRFQNYPAPNAFTAPDGVTYTPMAPGAVAAPAPAASVPWLGLLLVVGVGILMYYLGKNASAPAEAEPVAVLPNPYRRRRPRLSSRTRRARRRRAYEQPRDELGRFLPA